MAKKLAAGDNNRQDKNNCFFCCRNGSPLPFHAPLPIKLRIGTPAEWGGYTNHLKNSPARKSPQIALKLRDPRFRTYPLPFPRNSPSLPF
jgi:hypothetical protein